MQSCLPVSYVTISLCPASYFWVCGGPAGRYVICQTAAFAKDLISLPKLLELVVIPFLKVAEHINASGILEAPEDDDVKIQHDMRVVMLDSWREGLQTLLDGGMMIEGDVSLVFVPLTSSRQQAEITRALLDTGFFKVIFAKSNAFCADHTILSRFRFTRTHNPDHESKP